MPTVPSCRTTSAWFASCFALSPATADAACDGVTLAARNAVAMMEACASREKRTISAGTIAPPLPATMASLSCCSKSSRCHVLSNVKFPLNTSRIAAVWPLRVGAIVGAAVVGDVVGAVVGDTVGAVVGAAVVGAAVGLPVGGVGARVGDALGLAVGLVGLRVGAAVVGAGVGAGVGCRVGRPVLAASGGVQHVLPWNQHGMPGPKLNL